LRKFNIDLILKLRELGLVALPNVRNFVPRSKTVIDILIPDKKIAIQLGDKIDNLKERGYNIIYIDETMDIEEIINEFRRN